MVVLKYKNTNTQWFVIEFAYKCIFNNFEFQKQNRNVEVNRSLVTH